MEKKHYIGLFVGMFLGTFLLSTITMRLVPPRTRLVTRVDTLVQFRPIQPDLSVLYVRCPGKPLETFIYTQPLDWYYSVSEIGKHKYQNRLVITLMDSAQTTVYAETQKEKCNISRILPKS